MNPSTVNLGRSFALEALSGDADKADIVFNAGLIAGSNLLTDLRCAGYFEPGDYTKYAYSLVLHDEFAAQAFGGGQLVAAFPGFGVSIPLAPYAEHFPGYIAEKLPTIHGGSVGVIAGFLTVVSGVLAP